MPVNLTFNTPLNISVNVGDIVFHSPVSTGIYDISSGYKTVGAIKDITDRNTNQPVIEIADPVISTPSIGDFIFFAKSNEVNSSGLKGYYAKVKMQNDSDKKAELFSVGADIQQSSK